MNNIGDGKTIYLLEWNNFHCTNLSNHTYNTWYIYTMAWLGTDYILSMYNGYIKKISDQWEKNEKCLRFLSYEKHITDKEKANVMWYNIITELIYRSSLHYTCHHIDITLKW